jgi:hypothetical protein
MTKKELIELLAPFPDDTIVTTDGHSDGSGYSDIFSVTERTVVEQRSWQGNYATIASYNEDKPHVKIVNIS